MYYNCSNVLQLKVRTFLEKIMPYKQRLLQAQAILEALAIDALMVEDPIDIFYLLGVKVSTGLLVIAKEKNLFFVDGRYLAYAKENVFIEVQPIEKSFDFLTKFFSIGFDASFVTVDRFLSLEKKFSSLNVQQGHGVLKPLEKPLQNLRIIKDKNEIEKIKKAQELTRSGIAHLELLLKEGVREDLLAFEFEIFCRKNGAEKLSFDPIIAFGKNSAHPHHRAGSAKLEKNSIVLIDCGAVVDGYAGDMTRCFFYGDVDKQLLDDYATIQQAQKKAMQAIKVGVSLQSIDQSLRNVLKEANCENLFTHSLGHGIGLQTHEKPFFRKSGGDLQRVLEPGMVFTIEPGLYRDGIGGVRYEDIVVVTESGYETI